MNSQQEQRQIENILKLIGDLCAVDVWYRHGDRLDMTLTPRSLNLSAITQIISERLTLAGYTFSIVEQDQRLRLSVNARPRIRIPGLNILLFVLTLLSIYFFPVYESNGLSWANTLQDLRSGRGLVFTLALVSILLVHEMGHYLAGRRRGLASSWPYFIPAPTLIGTFGAVIRSKSPFWNRRDLIEVGAAGPIAGWVVAVGWLIYGLSNATVIEAGATSVKSIGFYLEGESLLVKLLTPLLAGHAPQGFVYIFPEAAFAGWVGILVTALNLLPIGQFDGGHIVYGLLPDMQRRLGWLAMVALVALGLQSPIWWIIAVMGFVMRVGHPPTLQDHIEPGRPAMIMGTIAMIILILSFTPTPFR
ncbi:MAG: site-2 protease family protein [candidate division Zixibacteria bacterium]|nr:site-2 protease family protein [candidate division Zixibacteria bacterium]